MEHDVDDATKVNRLYELLSDDEWVGMFSDFERRFIYDNYKRQTENNYNFSDAQSRVIDVCYEKAYRNGCFNDD